IPDGDGNIVWTYDPSPDPANPASERWRPLSSYKFGQEIRCAQDLQKPNLCIATSGGWSGDKEPLWAQNTTPSANAGNPGNAGSPGGANSPGQSDNQIVWAPYTQTNATPVQDVVI